MKMKRLLLCPALALVLSVNAFAMEVPTSTVTQNLNGSQQVIKTYSVSPETDPQKLIEEPFELEGYLYTFTDIVKEENHAEEIKRQTETVTVETTKNDLSDILEKLSPTLSYDDGTFKGTLALDHTSIHTEAAGYASRSSTLSETKVIGPVDRNDMSYVPVTTVKKGITLSLANVDWQVIGTDLVGETLAPSSYQAVATYTGKSYYSAATGYITTAEYVGEITRDDVESVIYTLTYLGEEADGEKWGTAFQSGEVVSAILPYALTTAVLAAIVILAALLLRSRRQLKQLQAEQEQSAGHYEEEEEQEA